MEIEDFKFIFFWEYFHRLWGRLIGIFFIIPFAYFIIKKKLNKNVFFKLIGVFLLGCLQAIIGWWMVKSGLVDRPDVSQYRLALHFGNSLLILFILYWLILDLKNTKSEIKLNLNMLVFLIIFFYNYCWFSRCGEWTQA